MAGTGKSGLKFFVLTVSFFSFIGSSAVVLGDQSLLVTLIPILARHTKAEKSWGIPELLSREVELSGDPVSIMPEKVVMDSTGNAFVVWRDWAGFVSNTIYIRRYEKDTGWQPPDYFGGYDDLMTYHSDIEVNPSGEAIVVWSQNDDPHTPDIWAKKYNVETGWGTPELLENDEAGRAYAPCVAMDLHGNAVVVWRQSDGTRYNIMANRYVEGEGWKTAELIEIDNLGDAYSPQVKVDSAGNAIAVWEQSDGVRKNIWANRYEAGEGWGTAELIEVDNSGDAELPQLGVDGAGNAFVVWQQFDGMRKNIWGNKYIPKIGWGTGELLETNNAGDAESPQLAVNRKGNIIALWQQFDGVVYNILSSQYTGGGWGKPELLENDNAGDAKDPQIAINFSGEAIAVWWQVDSNRRKNIIASRYTTGEGWGKAEPAENNDFGNACEPKVGIDPFGRALVIWQQIRSSLEGEPGGVSLWGNRYE